MKKTIIAWDLGGTKCAAGIVEYDPTNDHYHCVKETCLKLTDATSLADLIHQIESQLGVTFRDVDAICISAAGFYDGTHLIHANAYPFVMNFADIAQAQQWPAFAVIHDYASIICATFTSYMNNTHNIKRLNTQTINPHARRVAFGIGTGLGLKDGMQFPNGDFWFGHNEIGHMGITTPPFAKSHRIAMHHEFVKYLSCEVQHPTRHVLNFEKALSGQGLMHLHNFIHTQDKKSSPEEVGAKMRAEPCAELLDAFAWYIGLFVGAVQLIFMPEGGIWITGGVALTHLAAFDHPALQEGIEATPAYLETRANYPLGVMLNKQHALIGSAYYAVKKLL